MQGCFNKNAVRLMMQTEIEIQKELSYWEGYKAALEEQA